METRKGLFFCLYINLSKKERKVYYDTKTKISSNRIMRWDDASKLPLIMGTNMEVSYAQHNFAKSTRRVASF